MPLDAERRARVGVAGRVAVILGIVAIVLMVAWRSGLFALEDRAELAAAIERVRDVPFVPILFVLIYAVAGAAGVPATPFTLAGGALFGSSWGIALNWVGEMAAALLAFAATRATGVRIGARATDATSRASQFSGAGGARLLFRLRLIPVAPFALLNAGAALSGMSWRNYIVATALGITPITIIYTISASSLVAGVEGSGARALTTALVSAAVLVALSFIPSLVGARSRGKS
jgi:uncharacterized membrane protein YdjX (TVP38/TMEM64 family)